MSTPDKLRTLWALGAGNVARVSVYRVGLRLGLHPALHVEAAVPSGPFFRGNTAPSRAGAVATSAWRDKAVLFSFHEVPLHGPPDWHANPLRPGARADAAQPWWQIGDFDPALGDIKTVWEASRFDWLLSMSQRASLGERSEIERLNQWIDDWLMANPPYLGVNWKCGQEASFRVMHLAVAAMILGETRDPTVALRSLLRLHLERIAPTMGYAIGQQNNHGTSEAAALFVGGSWLAACGEPRGEVFMRSGRRWLEDRALALVAKDGTFSQYSVVYHRLMLDTYSLAEIWRRHLGLPAFSGVMTGRLQAATAWLYQLTDPLTGDAPNLGANDGARLMPLAEAGYRDFRPSLQLAATLHFGARALDEPGPWDQPGLWLGVNRVPTVLLPPRSASFDDGGLHVLRSSGAVAYLRYPRFRFRPSQADALHLDFWLDGENLLRDAGTYSYADRHPDAGDLGATRSHNTIEFDGRDQMPRLGRFLYGSWLQAEAVSCVVTADGTVTAEAGYRDGAGARHHRRVHLGRGRLICTDQIEGTAGKAVLRWRLRPGAWACKGAKVEDGRIEFEVTSNHPLLRVGLVEGCESRHYLALTPLPVLEVHTEVPATLTTEIRF